MPGMKVSQYAKFIVSALVAGGIILKTAIGDDVISASEMVDIALALLGALGVYVLPNAPKTGDAPKAEDVANLPTPGSRLR